MVLLIWVLLFHSSAAQLYQSSSTSVRTPRISYITKSQNVDIGSSTELECSVQYSRNYPVLWVKKGDIRAPDLPISTDSALIVRDSRYALRHDKGSTTYILQIKDLQQYDGGVYMCQVIIDITNRISESLTLMVRQPPFIFDNSSRTVVVMQRTPVKLECYAEGAPAPKVSWRRENNALLPTGGSVFSGTELLIPSIRKEDRGTYYCIADNGVGRGARRNVNVEVEFKPVVQAVKAVVRQAETFDALLQCRIESYPPADVNWIFRGESIVNNQNFRVSEFATDEDFSDVVLTVIAIEPRQFGNYTCRANNRLGWASTQILLEESITRIRPTAPDELTSPSVSSVSTTEDSIGTVEETTPCPCAQPSQKCEKETMEFPNLSIEELQRLLIVEQLELTRVQMKLAHKQIAQLNLVKHKLMKREIKSWSPVCPPACEYPYSSAEGTVLSFGLALTVAILHSLKQC